MSFFQRVATIAAMTFSLAGLISTSSPGIASEVAPVADRGTLPGTVPVTIVGTPAATAAPLVPQPSPAVLVDTIVSTGPARFSSLGDAVAAQEGTTQDEHLRCLAGAVYFESQGEPLPGQLAVAQVILNRTRSGRFPTDVCAVVTQRGQFGFVRGGAIPAVDTGRTAYRTAVAIAKVAIADAWHDPAPDALFFHAARSGMAARMRHVATIGNHVFYR